MRTNFDVYKKELELLQCGTDFGVNKTNLDIHHCDRMSCGDCLFNKAGYSCGQCRLKWLGTEYKEHLTTDSINILKMFDSKFKYIVRNKTWLKFFTEKDCGYKLIDYSMFNENIMNINFNILEENKRYSIEDLIEE